MKPRNRSAVLPRRWTLQAFNARHLHDYTPAAVRLWWLLALAGAAALAWALPALRALPAAELVQAGAALVLVVALAWMPVQIPRTKQTVLVADVFTFLLLVHFGPAAAIVAAGTEALAGALRTSRRLSTHVSAPATAMAAMAAGGLAYEALLPRAEVLFPGSPDAAMLATLFAVAALPAVISTASLMWLMALKRGRRLGYDDWLENAAWFIAMVLAAAFAAALIEMNTRRAGPVVPAVGAALSLLVVLLLRHTFGRQEAARLREEAKLATARAEADAHEQRFSAAFTHAAVGMAIVDADGRVLQTNQALCDLVGADASALAGTRFESLLEAGDARLLQARSARFASEGDGAFSMELRLRHAGDGLRWASLHCSRYAEVADSVGEGQSRLIYQLHDITSRRAAEGRLHHIAYHDGLTDLANRHCFTERLAAAAQRAGDGAFAVVFIDLDRFKVVNDSLGHGAGNELLRAVADRLQASVRPGDLVARLGGDEFALLLEGVSDAEHALQLAERLLQAVTRPLRINGTEVLPGASVGLTIARPGQHSSDELLRDADLAMYEAKAAGRGRVALFDPTMHRRVAEKLALEADLRHAIGEGQLTMAFQPLYELEPYRLTGFEALARWTHPQRGVVSPAVFIALAEETGHIDALTDWVVDHVVGQLAQWQADLPHAAPGMHVNISGRDLARAGFVEHVQQVLARHGVAPSRLTLEITETTLMGQLDVSLDALERLRAHGVRFSIDDFGTGYSSLAYLSRLPIDSLKIDRSFIAGMSESRDNVEIVRAVLTLAHTLGHKVVAEGIETVQQLETLRRLGVNVGQGYLLGRPLRADDATRLLRDDTGASQDTAAAELAAA